MHAFSANHQCQKYFYNFLPIYGTKFKIPIAVEILDFSWHLDNQHLMDNQWAQQWYIFKNLQLVRYNYTYGLILDGILQKRSQMSKCQKNVQNWQLYIIYQLSKSETVGLWMILIISIAKDWPNGWCVWRYLHRLYIFKENWIIWIKSKCIRFLRTCLGH